MRVLQIIEIPRAAQQIDINYFHIAAALFYFLRVKHGRRDLPILGEHQSIGRDRAEEVLNIIIGNKVMPAVVEWPIRTESCRGCQNNRSDSSDRRCPNRRTSRSSNLDKPLDTESSRNRDGNKRWQIVRVLVLSNFVAQRVSQVGEDDQQQKPKGRAVALTRAREPRPRQKQRQRQPCKAKFAQGHLTKLNELRSHSRRRKREEDPILPASDMPPNFLKRPRIAPVHRRRSRGCPRQITIHNN